MGSAAALSAFQTAPYSSAVELPEPYLEHTAFPLTLTPPKPDTPLSDLVSGIKDLSSSGQIRSLLNTHGALFFKHLNLQNAEEFSHFAHAFGFVPHEDIGNPVRRTVLAKNVATANEGPHTQPVYPHNEFGLSPHFPAYVFFFSLSAPTSGGETPINNSIVLYHQLKAKHPDFIAEIEAKGVKYQLFYPNGPRDQTSSPATSVLQAYGQHVLESDDVETARQRSRRRSGGCRRRRGRGRIAAKAIGLATSEYGSSCLLFLNALAAGTLLPPHINKDGAYQPPAFYGDGSLIPREYFESAVGFIKETRALVGWTKGDVLLLDNFAVQHGREPWTGERKLLASLWDEP